MLPPARRKRPALVYGGLDQLDQRQARTCAQPENFAAMGKRGRLVFRGVASFEVFRGRRKLFAAAPEHLNV